VFVFLYLYYFCIFLNVALDADMASNKTILSYIKLWIKKVS